VIKFIDSNLVNSVSGISDELAHHPEVSGCWVSLSVKRALLLLSVMALSIPKHMFIGHILMPHMCKPQLFS
jgi:hypothetical protein